MPARWQASAALSPVRPAPKIATGTFEAGVTVEPVSMSGSPVGPMTYVDHQGYAEREGRFHPVLDGSHGFGDFGFGNLEHQLVVHREHHARTRSDWVFQRQHRELQNIRRRTLDGHVHCDAFGGETPSAVAAADIREHAAAPEHAPH